MTLLLCGGTEDADDDDTADDDDSDTADDDDSDSWERFVRIGKE